MKNSCLNAALDELADAGIRDVAHAPGGKHRQLRWQANGTTRFYNVSVGAPSDSRSIANTRANIRRMLKADGMLVDRLPPAPKPLDRVGRLEARVAELELKISTLLNGGGKP
jgi:hypothetical protein